MPWATVRFRRIYFNGKYLAKVDIATTLTEWLLWGDEFVRRIR
jgi:hypothetical protein